MFENNPEHHYITLPLALHLSFEKAFLPAIIVLPDSPHQSFKSSTISNFQTPPKVSIIFSFIAAVSYQS